MRVENGRYERQVLLWGRAGQEKLGSSSVAVVGVGGLGSNAALILALEGVGRLILVDHDKVEESNLNRQPLYREDDVGRPKAVVAAERLRELNPGVRIEAYTLRVSRETLDELRRIIRRVDIVIDGLDSWEARHVLDEAVWVEGRPLVHGAVEEWRGQATTIIPGRTPCLRCLVPRPTPPRPVPVAPPLVTLVASIQALEATRILIGQEPSLAGTLLYIDGVRGEFHRIEVSWSRGCEDVCGRVGDAGLHASRGEPPAR